MILFHARAYCWGFGATVVTGWVRACRVEAAAGHWLGAWVAAAFSTALAVALLAPVVGARLPSACEQGALLFPQPKEPG